MAKVISIWGKGGAGKSTITANLASHLAKEGHVVGILGTSKTYGSIQHYFGMQIAKDKSLKRALNVYEEEDIVKRFSQHPTIKNLFVLSLSNDEDCMSIGSITEDEGKRLILNTKDAFDYYIIDCTESFKDTLTLLGLIYADKVIEIVKPTIQGTAFRMAHADLMDSLKITDKLVSITNNNSRFLDTNEIEKELNIKFEVVLPYAKGVERSENDGRPIILSGAANRAEKDFINGIKSIAVSIVSGEAAQKAAKRRFSSILKRGKTVNG